jgi:CBS domain-containing protein
MCAPTDELGSILTKDGSSHEPIYVFDKEQFLGLISPYHTLFRNRYAYATKAAHCLIVPPYITAKTDIYDIARYMVDLKLYSLPLFDSKNTIQSIVTGDAIISQIGGDTLLLQHICTKIELHTPITASTHSTVADAYALMREKQIGKVILINSEHKMKGVLSRKDLQNISFKHAQKTSYQTKKSTKSHATLQDILITHEDEPALRFASAKVNTSSNKESLKVVIKKMIRFKLSSLVIINNGIPTGFLSRQDILRVFATLKPQNKVPIIWENSILHFKELPMNDFYVDVDMFVMKISKQLPTHNIEIHISRPLKQSHTDKPQYYIKLHLHLKTGKTLLAEGHNPHIQTALKNAVHTLLRQSDQSNKQKHSIHSMKDRSSQP